MQVETTSESWECGTRAGSLHLGAPSEPLHKTQVILLLWSFPREPPTPCGSFSPWYSSYPGFWFQTCHHPSSSSSSSSLFIAICLPPSLLRLSSSIPSFQAPLAYPRLSHFYSPGASLLASFLLSFPSTSKPSWHHLQIDLLMYFSDHTIPLLRGPLCLYNKAQGWVSCHSSLSTVLLSQPFWSNSLGPKAFHLPHVCLVFHLLLCLDSAQSPPPLLGHHLAQNNISLSWRYIQYIQSLHHPLGNLEVTTRDIPSLLHDTVLECNALPLCVSTSWSLWKIFGLQAPFRSQLSCCPHLVFWTE